jgi:hypothetical protein
VDNQNQVEELLPPGQEEEQSTEEEYYYPENDEESVPEKEEDKWEPNWKVKVMDSEVEIDESLRPAVTKDNYDKVKELYEKAYGLEHVKTKNQQLSEKVQQNDQVFQALNSLREQKEYGRLFQSLKIPDDEVMKYALERAKIQELPEQERQRYTEHEQAVARQQQLEAENKRLQQQMQHSETQARLNTLDQELGTMGDLVSQFDSRAGQPGAFKKEVIQRGLIHYYQTGQDLPVKDAVEQTMRIAGLERVQTQPQASGQFQQKPVIPRIRSGHQAPAKKVVGSIADLKNLYHSLE